MSVVWRRDRRKPRRFGGKRIASTLISLFALPLPLDAQVGDWLAYGRTAAGDRHSPLTEITPENVAGLAIAWRYRTDEPPRAAPDGRPPRTAATPLAIGGRLFLSTALGKVIALDGATGRELWRYDAKVDPTGGFGDFVSRGVSFWRDRRNPDRLCAQRIIAGTVDARLIALDLTTGTPCREFGTNGQLSLRTGLRNRPDRLVRIRTDLAASDRRRHDRDRIGGSGQQSSRSRER